MSNKIDRVMIPRMMRLLAVVAILSAAIAAPTAAQTRYQLIEIENVPADSLRKGIMLYDDYNKYHLVSMVYTKATLIANEHQVDSLAGLGYAVKHVMSDTSLVRLYRRALYGPSEALSPFFLNYERIEFIGDSLQRRYPNLISRIDIGNSTSRDVPMLAYRISNQADRVTDRPAVFLNGVHHADEILGAEILVDFMEKLVNDYGSDERVTRWLDELEIYILPVVNIDGYERITSGEDPRWRKVPVTREQKYPEGTDPNRTYDFNWNLGGDGNPTSGRYRGEVPFSIKETKAVADFATRRPLVASISYHSQGEVLFYPWAWGDRKAPDHAVISHIADNMASKITKMDGSATYGSVPGAGTVGQSYPWLYGRLGTIDIVVETGLGSHIFPEEASAHIIRENLKGLDYFMERMRGPGLAGTVRDAATGEALKAEVRILQAYSEDIDARFSQEGTGRFRRLLLPGAYDLLVIAPGYATERRRVEVKEGPTWTEVEVQLKRP